MGLELATQESRSTDWVSQPGSLPTIWFWLAFPLWLMMLMIFSCPYWSFVGPLWRNVYSNLLLIFKLGYFSFYQDTCSLYILYTRSLIRNVICKKKKKKIPILWILLSLLLMVSFDADFSVLIMSSVCHFCCCCLCFGVISKELLPIQSHESLLLFSF